MLVSERGDDFTMTLGKDISMGFDFQDKNKLHLYLMESFTFQVLEPGASIIFE